MVAVESLDVGEDTAVCAAQKGDDDIAKVPMERLWPKCLTPPQALLALWGSYVIQCDSSDFQFLDLLRGLIKEVVILL